MLPTLPPPVDPDANEAGDENIFCDVPVGVEISVAGGAEASAIEKLEKSRGSRKCSIVMCETKKKCNAANSFKVLIDRIKVWNNKPSAIAATVTR